MRRSGMADHVFISLHVIVPIPAFMYVRLRELPVLLRIVETFHESPLLFLFGNIQKEFANDYAIAREILFKRADVFIALLPYLFGNQPGWKMLPGQKFLVDPHHQNFFIIRAVEDADLAALRKVARRPPEVVVV